MIYLDNASTTFPKPDCVYAETMERFRGYGVSPSRGCYSAARVMNDVLLSMRLSLAKLFNVNSADNIILSPSATIALNQILQGLDFRKIRTVYVSPFEHNALGDATYTAYDAEGRVVSTWGATYPVAYAYDAYGRFAAVTSHSPLATSDFSFTYSYLSGSSLISGMTASSGHSWSRSYEPARSLITAVENRFGETVISRFDYVNDEIGRRVSRADSGQAFQNPAFDVYSYNARSEVIGAQRYHGTNPADTSRPFGGRGFGYAFDPIGNRTSATETIGGETLTKTYVANELNQYTSIDNPDAVGLRGSATNTATVTVNGNAALSDSIASDTVPWHYALLADNADSGAYTFASIMAVVNPPGMNTPDIVESTSGSVYAPPQAEVLAYDDDGNLLSDGRWEYTWNGENRLVKAEELISPTNREPYVVEYAYDHRGRLIWKTIASPNAPPSKTMRYLWDDYNIVAETVAQDTATKTTYNIWGLDLDGTLQGAGGVGGLLAVVSPLPLGEGQGEGSTVYLPCYDANGNVMEYVASDGTIVGHREYDPFGGTVVYTSQSAITNQQFALSFSHWFSTKPWCVVTGLSEYQYRKYSPVLGRWMSRDPWIVMAEPNLYTIAGNSTLVDIDVWGAVAYNKLKAENVFVQSGNPGKENRANVAFQTMLSCSCSGSNDCFVISCTLTEDSATITIDYSEAKRSPGGIDARVGHEQFHISNWMKFNQDMVRAVAPWEAVKFVSKEDCDIKANAIIMKYGKLKGEFNKREINHENFVKPKASTGYKRITVEELLEKGRVVGNPSVEYIPPDFKVDFERL